MNLPETAELLAFAQAFDQRTVGRADVIAWQGVLADAPFEDCQEAVKRHYTEHTERLMPAHVLRLLGEIAAERAKAKRKWAPGQYGVAADEAMPEISGPIDDSNMPEDVKAKLRELLTERFGPSDRELLKPRTVAWEREHATYARQRGAEPNPYFRPRTLAEAQAGGRGYSAGDRVWVDEMPSQPRVCRGAVCEAEPCVLRDGGECG